MVMKPGRWLAAAAAIILVVASRYGTTAGVAPDPVAARSPAPEPVVQGAGSCAAIACHGSIAPVALAFQPAKPVLRNEHTTWITQDLHANAYAVLFARRSREMATRLNHGKLKAHEDARCLACHTTAGTGPTQLPANVVRADGVSCESCHGAAEHWLGPHTQAWWNRQSPAEKQARYGMRPTRALADRVAICVDCHVGSPGRDVNHDLIAAGHPRLNFEFAAFLANMPPHWVEDKGGSFPAQAWAVGQAATARAAADLLARRAREASASGRPSPWPEFSEYDCFACHHDLADQPWRQARAGGGAGRAPGTPTWGTWCYPAALTLARQAGGPQRALLEEAFTSVQTEMGRFGSDPAKVSAAAQGLADALGRWLQSLPDDARRLDPPKLKSLIATVRTNEPGGFAPGWDGAAQRYLALQPLQLSLKALEPASADPALDTELQSLFTALKFREGFDSPQGYNPGQPSGNR
jgi:hypothetical protein